MTNQINSSFSRILPNLQLAWDSVSRGALITCPRYYQYTIINGYITKSENVHFIFGIGIHSSIELYNRERTKGKTHHQSLLSAARFAIEYTWNFERKRPWISDEPTKNRETLIRTVIWYLDQFKEDPLETVIIIDKDGKETPAVELSFQFDSGLISISDESYILCGHLDRFATRNGRYIIPDVKTTKYSLTKHTHEFFAKFTPDDQISGYYFAGGIIFDKPISGMVIDAIQTAVNFSRFQRGEITRSKSQLEEWYKDTGYLFKEAETYAKENYWPQRTKSCDRFGGCPFRPICSEPPEMRQQLLDKFYIKRTWDPMISREV